MPNHFLPVSLFAFVCFARPALALIPPGTADATTAEGWHAEGFPVDDYIPWSLQFEGGKIAGFEGKYLVIAGYLVATPSSVVLFPDEQASKSGSLNGALVLSREDSPALRWLFSGKRYEGYYAVGGVFVRAASNGMMLGDLRKVRFAMKNEQPNHPPEPTQSGVH